MIHAHNYSILLFKNYYSCNYKDGKYSSLFSLIWIGHNSGKLGASIKFVINKIYHFLPILLDRYGLKEVSKVEKLQETFIECLKREVTRRDWKNRQLFARLLMQITSLRSVSMLFNKAANNFRRAWPYVEVPPLLEEILDYEY